MAPLCKKIPKNDGTGIKFKDVGQIQTLNHSQQLFWKPTEVTMCVITMQECAYQLLCAESGCGFWLVMRS